MSLKAQMKMGIGMAGTANWIHGGIGADVRFKLELNERLRVIPQFNYSSLATLNVMVNEWYVGANVHYAFIRKSVWRMDALGGVHYNRWPNYQNYNTNLAQLNNMVGEIGLALVKDNTCISPFIEHRYNLKWRDASTRVGVYAMLVGRRGKSGGYSGKKSLPCPRLSSF